MSSYVESVLSSGEEVVYKAKVSFWSMLPLFILGLLLLGCMGIGVFFWIAAIMRYVTTELAITNKKIIAKFGFIRRYTIELLLHKAEGIQVSQSVFGRMLNYGSILVSGGGSTQTPIPGIVDPIAFKRKFSEMQEQAEKKKNKE